MVISTVLALALRVQNWIDSIERRKEVMIAIARQTELLTHIIEQVRQHFGDFESSDETVRNLVVPPMLDLGSTLRKVLEHLDVWENPGLKRSAIAIVALGYVLGIFERHRQRLSDGIQILQLALTASHIVAIVPLTIATKENSMKHVRNSEVDRVSDDDRVFHMIRSIEVRLFWEINMGDKV